MNDLLVKVRDIALNVRSWAERKAEACCGDPDSLVGFCAIASGELHTRLQRAGIDSEIHVANQGCSCHVFVVVDDQVVDVTATQFKAFKGQVVLIKHHRELEQHWFYQNTEVFKSAKDLRKNQLRVGWVRDQIAYG